MRIAKPTALSVALRQYMTRELWSTDCLYNCDEVEWPTFLVRSGYVVLKERLPAFRPQWETVLTPVETYLSSRPKVDSDPIALLHDQLLIPGLRQILSSPLSDVNCLYLVILQAGQRDDQAVILKKVLRHAVVSTRFGGDGPIKSEGQL